MAKSSVGSEPASAARPSSRSRMLEAATRLFTAKGYEKTSTAAIARAAGTSESQLMKHFGGKEGLLEAIFQQAWQQFNTTLRAHIGALAPPSQKLRAAVELVSATLNHNPQLKILMLLEGRRIRREGRAVLITQGFMEFLEILDGILREMREAGELRNGLHPEAVRSALMGAWEGLMRDQLLAELVGFPDRFGPEQVQHVFEAMFSACCNPVSGSAA